MDRIDRVGRRQLHMAGPRTEAKPAQASALRALKRLPDADMKL